MEVKRRTVKTLVTKLGSVSERTRVDALCELRLMTKLDAESRPLIAEAGAVPYLAETLYSSSHSSQDNSAATLLSLSISSRATFMSTRGLLDAISHILRRHSPESPHCRRVSTHHSFETGHLLGEVGSLLYVVGAMEVIAGG
ncbi:U-box domain-containing protein 17-like [Quercus lobata]|uniref:Uncharacterized protein n=1 Tax=Quercus lobata TaxID=97700 RepID=A0A7N2LCB8_QUELO|nr:U-box domain-containing protein 17-like [Quercus lobata]